MTQWQAQEVFLEKPYDEKADLFSFAIIAYELLHRFLMICATDGSPEEVYVSPIFLLPFPHYLEIITDREVTWR